MRRHPDPGARGPGSRKALHLVAVVVRHEDVGHLLDAELVHVVEHGSAAEVDHHGLAAGCDDVDVARVAETGDARPDLLEGRFALHV